MQLPLSTPPPLAELHRGSIRARTRDRTVLQMPHSPKRVADT